MNYHLYQRGKDQGIFSLEELRRRHEAGELTGNEPVWTEGMGQWQPLRVVLQGGYAPLNRAAGTAPASRPGRSPVVNAILVFAVLLVLATMIGMGTLVYRGIRMGREATANLPGERQVSAMQAATNPVTWTSNTLTVAEVQKKQRLFRVRQYIEGYQLRGQRNPECDLLAQQFMTNWIALNFGGPADTNLPPLGDLRDRLAKDPACQDPVVLTVVAVTTDELHECRHRLERALKAFENSKHLGYPKFYAAATLANKWEGAQNDRLPALDHQALQQLAAALTDGSLQPEDEEQLCDILVSGWAKTFFQRQTKPVIELMHQQGAAYQWLALVLAGQDEITQAWQARGNGYANTVSAEAWRGFSNHLKAARKDLTRAWQLHPERALAPDLMIRVSLGDADISEMREWFDRTTTAQLDYPDAWDEMRWGLRPRWFGNYDAMLAFGVTALHTRRFDTDVPRKFFDVVNDLGADQGLPKGEFLFAEDNIWPHLQELYQGYVAQPSLPPYDRDGWRSSYAVVASLAGKYDVAAEQLQALHWEPHPENLTGWYHDLTLLPQEIAARTRSQSAQVNAAEASYEAGNLAAAWQVYHGLLGATNLDALTESFVRNRAAALEQEQRLDAGGWIDFLPADDQFTGWHVDRGHFQRLPDGALEVHADQAGHLIYSRAQIGTEFEVRGQFEVVRSTTAAFQGGLVMGIPQWQNDDWYAFRMKRNSDEGDLASFSQHWTERQITAPLKLDSATNSFDVRFQHGRFSAAVNGQEVFKQARPPRGSFVGTNEFMLGLGAFNDSNSTVIRYRNVQARRL